jgi:hypothetical protein
MESFLCFSFSISSLPISIWTAHQALPRLLDGRLLTFAIRPSCCILVAQTVAKYCDSLIMWAAIEVISSGEHFVVGLLLSNLSRFEAPYGDNFLGYTYSLDGTTPSFWQSTAST